MKTCYIGVTLILNSTVVSSASSQQCSHVCSVCLYYCPSTRRSVFLCIAPHSYRLLALADQQLASFSSESHGDSNVAWNRCHPWLVRAAKVDPQECNEQCPVVADEQFPVIADGFSQCFLLNFLLLVFSQVFATMLFWVNFSRVSSFRLAFVKALSRLPNHQAICCKRCFDCGVYD